MRDADVVLADGGSVHLRSIEPTDGPALVGLHARTSERSRYLRFFSAYPKIPAADLRRFVNVDHRDREAIVAVVPPDVIGVARYERLGAAQPDAEVAFLVEDAHQHRGIGRVLLAALAEAGRDAGVVRFVADVLPGNNAMLHVFTEAGYPVEAGYADGVVHVAFPISDTAAPSP
jgi:GNAT superfamily N-acetyltransferase